MSDSQNVLYPPKNTMRSPASSLTANVPMLTFPTALNADIKAAVVDSAGNVYVNGICSRTVVKYAQPAVPGLPTIITPPQGATMPSGTNVMFSVMATGAPPLSYQWSYQGQMLVGATNATLTLTNIQITNSGPYTVVVSNSIGSVVSASGVMSRRSSVSENAAWICGSSSWYTAAYARGPSSRRRSVNSASA